MAIKITSTELLREYLEGVMERADHHAKNVNEVALTIAGAITWRATGELEVKERDSEMKNVLWFPVNGNRYAVAFNHKTGNIELRGSSMRGAVLYSMNNSNTAAEIKHIFASL